MRRPGSKRTLVPTLATMVVLPLLVGLGLWQLDRAREKAEIKHAIEARGVLPAIIVGADAVIADDAHFRLAEARGEYQPDYQILLDNKVHNGRAGYHVLTPLRIAGSNWWLLVNRGWVPWGLDRRVLPDIDTPVGPVTLTGRLRRPSSKYFTLQRGPPADGQFETRWQVLDLARYARVVDRPVYPVVLELDPEDGSGGGFTREWSGNEDVWIARHRGYALQWFSLAVVLAIIFVVLQLRSRSRSNGNGD